MTTVYIVHMYLASGQLFHNIDLIGTLHTDYFGHHNLTITQPILKLPSPIVCDNFQCQLVKKKRMKVILISAHQLRCWFVWQKQSMKDIITNNI